MMLSGLKDDDAYAIDFETFYSSKDGYSLTKMTPYAYVRDARFDPYLVSVAHKGTKTYVGRPEDFDWTKVRGHVLLAHNAGFDSVVCDRLVELRRIPSLDGCQWQDTADLTAYLLVQRNLKAATKWLLGREISKAVRAGMDGRHVSDLDPQELRDLYAYGGSDADECLEIWLKYAAEWPDIERRISCQNRDAVKRGFMVDRPYAEESLKCLLKIQAQAKASLPWAADDEDAKAGSLPALKEALRARGIEPPKSFKKDDPGFLEWSAEHDDIDFVHARTRYAGTVQHVARIQNLLDQLDPRDVVRPGLLYFGAHSGRFTAGASDDMKGAKNINMLNLPRTPVFKGDPMAFDGKGIDLRGMYIPRPGYKYVIFDYSQIEARFSLWLAGEMEMMDCLKTEGNLYQANAVRMGWCKSRCDLKHTDAQKYRLAKCCLAGNSLVLVRPGGRLTTPCYKTILSISRGDMVWDGSSWVSHDGVMEVKNVGVEELASIGGVWATRDHAVYTEDGSSSQLGDVLDRGQDAAAVAWGTSRCPVQGWTHVRLLAAALAGAVARVLVLVARRARGAARPVRVHGVRARRDAGVVEREAREDDTMRALRPEERREASPAQHLGEDAR